MAGDVAAPSPAESPSSQAAPPCAVCGLLVPPPGLECWVCGLAVHEPCYVWESRGRSSWLCDPCADKVPPGEGQCALCPLKGGALKASSTGEWVHAVCSLWTPETYVGEDGKVANLHGISKSRRNKPCSLCSQSQGAVSSCSSPRCPAAFHPSCARQGGLPVLRTPVGPLEYALYCASHSGTHMQEAQPLHSDEAAAAPATGRGEGDGEGEAPCSVCGVSNPAPNLQCWACRVAVHAPCYDWDTGSTGRRRNWVCDPCAERVPTEQAQCVLCPLKGGALKPAATGEWVHAVCSLWTPETFVGSDGRVENLKGIPRGRHNKPCSICSSTQGVVGTCSVPRCRVMFHPLCGREAGLPVRRTPGGGIEYVMYCSEHSAAPQ